MSSRSTTVAARLIKKSTATSSMQFTQTRYMSSPSRGSMVLERLRVALAEYTSKQCSQELPSRVRREIVDAARSYSSTTTVSSSQREIVPAGLNQVLANINMQEQIPSEDVETLFATYSEDQQKNAISVERMLTILSDKSQAL
eukprot:CAMPEP_0119548630 /NCGR_PEP_ID=MMETSP1352-20130426/2499_1 /TAXON_ID=265584 /ORGANISM="Stauroneis constricta, Strain CCMP1120" /LENGTH=142 /DNA_ID=CAMNT_0007593951 /DNA_START=283 /DNA_END=711 /DNA_ORIENTATION=+